MASDLGSDLEEDSVLEASLMEWASKFKPKGKEFLIFLKIIYSFNMLSIRVQLTNIENY